MPKAAYTTDGLCGRAAASGGKMCIADTTPRLARLCFRAFRALPCRRQRPPPRAPPRRCLGPSRPRPPRRPTRPAPQGPDAQMTNICPTLSSCLSCPPSPSPPCLPPCPPCTLSPVGPNRVLGTAPTRRTRRRQQPPEPSASSERLPAPHQPRTSPIPPDKSNLFEPRHSR